MLLIQLELLAGLLLIVTISSVVLISMRNNPIAD